MSSRKSLIVMIALTILGLAVEGGISGPLGILGSIIDITVFALVVSSIGKWLRPKEQTFLERMKKNILLVGSIFGIFSGIFLTALFAINSFPAALSEVTLSDGKRKVVFLQMSHIGTKRYYEEANSLLRAQALSGAVFYLEGVRPGTQENQDRFDQALGFRISSGTYEDIAKSIGMYSQDETLYDGIMTGSLRLVDLSIDDIVGLLTVSGSQVVSGEPPVEFGEYLGELRDMPKGPLFSHTIRAVLNLSLRYTASSDDLLSSVLDPAVKNSILEKRNDHVIETFLESEDDHVVIVYGALHFEGMYALLKQANPDWHIVSLRPLYPYRP